MIVLATQPTDIEKLSCQPQQLSDWTDVQHALAHMEPENLHQFCRTFWMTEPVAIVGVFRKWGNHWAGFSVLGSYVVEHPMGFCRQYRRLLDSTFEDFGMDRLEVTGRCDHPDILRWMRFLGFEVEGRLRRYGMHGEDAWILSRIRKDSRES